MKKKSRKSSGVKAPAYGHTANSITNISRKVHFTIDTGSTIEDLKQHILKESIKNNIEAVLILIRDGRNFSLENIEKLGKFIRDNKIDVTVRPIGNFDFTEMAMVIFWSTYHIFFPEETSIYMRTLKSISENKLKEIVKRMSEIIVCDEQDLIKYYKQKAVIEPNMIFEEEVEDYCDGKQNMNPIQIDGSYYKRR